MKTTAYFRVVQTRSDRQLIQERWIRETVANPEFRLAQADGRIRLWRRIAEFGDRYLRVVVLEDGETVHNAFFDRRFKQ